MYKREQFVGFISEFLKLRDVYSDQRIGCFLIISSTEAELVSKGNLNTHEKVQHRMTPPFVFVFVHMFSFFK